MSNYYLTQEDYLMHHGVKGQKWGVRQWQNPDGSLTPAGRIHYGYGEALNKGSKITSNIGSGARTLARNRTYGRIGSSIVNRVGTVANRTSRNMASLKKIHDSEMSGGKKLLKSLSYMALPTVRDAVDPYTGEKTGQKQFGRIAGSGWKANNQKALADQYATSEHYRTTKTGRYISTVQKKNAESFAKYYQNRADSNSVKEYVRNTFSGYMKTPYTRLTGKETTVGKELVKGVLTLGIGGAFGVGGMTADAAKVWIGRQGVKNYKDDTKKAQVQKQASKYIALRDAKASYKKKDKEIQDRYYKQIENLEKGYKRGQMLSEEDQRRELEYDRAAQEAWAKNKENYQKRVKEIRNR